MSSTAYDDQFITVNVAGGGGGGGSSSPGYGAIPVTGAVGASGNFTLPSGTITITSPHQWGTLSTSSSYASNVTMSTSILSIQAHDGGDAYIKTHKNKINLDELAESVAILKQRLLILTPNFELHEKYPVLKDLYEQYKVVEAMLKEEDNK